MPDRLRDRSTGELVVLALTGAVVFLLLVVGAGVVLIELAKPGVDTGPATRFLNDAVNIVLGGITGYIAGRGVGRRGDELANGDN